MEKSVGFPRNSGAKTISLVSGREGDMHKLAILLVSRKEEGYDDYCAVVVITPLPP